MQFLIFQKKKKEKETKWYDIQQINDILIFYILQGQKILQEKR